MKKTLFTLLAVVFALCFLVCGGLIIKYFVESDAQAQVYNDLATQREQALEEAMESTDPQETPKGRLPEFDALYEENPDIAGWLKIEGTKLDYPVMYKPDSKDYYLRRNFYGEKATAGCLYIQETCEVAPQSDQLVIYGHNMKNGSMFACLKGYLKKDFYEAHPIIQFSTLTERAEYEVFAVFTTTASVGKGFQFHTYIDMPEEETFREFVDTCKELSVYDTGIEPQPGDKFISLVTCEYTQTNGRLVVVARKIK